MTVIMVLYNLTMYKTDLPPRLPIVCVQMVSNKAIT